MFEMHYDFGREGKTICDASTDGRAAGAPTVERQAIDTDHFQHNEIVDKQH